VLVSHLLTAARRRNRYLEAYAERKNRLRNHLADLGDLVFDLALREFCISLRGLLYLTARNLYQAGQVC